MPALRPVRIVLRRHAERPPNSEMLRSENIGITQKGKRQAIHVGRSIRSSVGKNILFFSTNKRRTKETAQGMMRGAHVQGEPRVLRKLLSLVRPSAKVEHLPELKKLAERTNEDIQDAWINGKIGKHLLYTPEEVVENVVRYGMRTKALQSKLGKYRIEIVLHDSTLIALAHTFLGRIPFSIHRSTKGNPSKIGYLEAMQLSIEPERVRLRFRKKWYDITKKYNEIADNIRSKNNPEKNEKKKMQ